MRLCVQESAWGPIDILLLVVGFIEALVAITTAALCCVAMCCRSRESDAAVRWPDDRSVHCLTAICYFSLAVFLCFCVNKITAKRLQLLP